MAGDWMPIRLDLAEDPSVIQMAAELRGQEMLTQIDEDWVVGKLVRIWSWASRQLHNCHASGVTKVFVDAHVRHDGFADAMERAGWLRVVKGGLEFPNWDNWMSQSAKKRVVNAQRQRAYRGKQSDQQAPGVSQHCHAASVTKALPQNRTAESEYNADCAERGTRPDNTADAAASLRLKGRLKLFSGADGLPLTEADWRAMAPMNRAQRILERGGCDASFRVAVGKHVRSHPEALPVLERIWERYAARKAPPANPGGWWRTVLQKEGIAI